MCVCLLDTYMYMYINLICMFDVVVCLHVHVIYMWCGDVLSHVHVWVVVWHMYVRTWIWYDGVFTCSPPHTHTGAR